MLWTLLQTNVSMGLMENEGFPCGEIHRGPEASAGPVLPPKLIPREKITLLLIQDMDAYSLFGALLR